MQLRKLGQMLKRARLAAGLTQGQLAERTGVDSSHVSRIEQGKRGATIATWNALLGACGVQWSIDVHLPDELPTSEQKDLFARSFQRMTPEVQTALIVFLEHHDPQRTQDSEAAAIADEIVRGLKN